MKKTYSEIQRSFWRQDKTKRRDAQHPVVAWIYRRQAQKLKERLTGTVTSILDCGCGNGFFQTYLSEVFELECVGLDFSPEMLRINRNQKKVTGSVLRIPFNDNSFDLVTCSMLLHHLTEEEQLQALQEMFRVSRKYIFIAEPNRNNPANYLFGLIHADERGLLRFSKSYMQSMCERIGLQVIAMYVDSLLLPNVMPVCLLKPMSMLDKTIVSKWFGFNCNVVGLLPD